MSELKNQFLELVKNCKGKSNVETVISSILESDLYITSEFLDCPKIKELGADNKHYNTLYLFSMLTYKDYKKQKAKYLALNDKLLNKLKSVSILELAKEQKFLHYSKIKDDLDIKTNFNLEELLFNLISKNLIQGKINAQDETISILSVRPRLNLRDNSKAKEKIDKIIQNLNVAKEFIENEEKRIKEETEEINGVLTI